MADERPSDDSAQAATGSGLESPVSAPRVAPPRPGPPPPPSARNRPPPPSSFPRRPPPPPPRPKTSASGPPAPAGPPSVQPPEPSFPPAPDYSRTLSGIGPITPEPPATRDVEPDSARVVELLRRVSDHEERARVLLAEREVWRGEQRALRTSGEELHEKVTRLEDEARLAAGERELLVRELSDSRAEAGRHEATAREQAELRLRLGDEHATTVAALTRRLAELEAELAGRRALEARLVELERKAERLMELERRHAELEQALTSANERLREHEAGGNRPPPGDDLTRLKGIGPTYDRALRAAGITSFAEIASWTDDDVVRIAGVLRARPERIRREDWIASARLLLEGD